MQVTFHITIHTWQPSLSSRLLLENKTQKLEIHNLYKEETEEGRRV